MHAIAMFCMEQHEILMLSSRQRLTCVHMRTSLGGVCVGTYAAFGSVYDGGRTSLGGAYVRMHAAFGGAYDSGCMWCYDQQH